MLMATVPSLGTGAIISRRGSRAGTLNLELATNPGELWENAGASDSEEAPVE